MGHNFNMASLGRAISTLGLRSPIRNSLRATLASNSYSSFADPKTCDINTVEKVTHTGQKYSGDDYRRVRFIDKEKLVNKSWAIDLVAEDPIVVVNARNIWSDGGGALGHPKVYINLDKPQVQICGYSGRKFIQKKFYNEAEHGPSITYEEYSGQYRS